MADDKLNNGEGQRESKAQEILNKLQEVFEDAGLEVTLVGIEGDTLYLDMKRTAKGLPAAFMVQAIGGTFRRYMPSVQKTALRNYVGLPNSNAPDEQEVPPEKPLVSLRFKGLPTLDVQGLDRQRATRALENFLEIVEAQGRDTLHVINIDTDDVKSGLKRVCHFSGAKCQESAGPVNALVIKLHDMSDECHDSDVKASPCAPPPDEPPEVVPGKLLLN